MPSEQVTTSYYVPSNERAGSAVGATDMDYVNASYERYLRDLVFFFFLFLFLVQTLGMCIHFCNLLASCNRKSECNYMVAKLEDLLLLGLMVFMI